jgi:DNA-binding transcriptional regulator YhcF (GntR family)
MSESASLLRDSYASVARFLLSPMVDFLAAGRTTFDGDLDRALIFLVVALRTVEHRKTQDLRLEDVLAGQVESYHSLLTNVRSIAESTGIPRETVRRKVAALVDKGWLEKRGDELTITPLATREITPFREAMLDVADRLHALVERVKSERG